MSAYRVFRASERGSPPAKVAKPAEAGAPGELGLATLATLADGQRGSEPLPLDNEGLPCGCCPAYGRAPTTRHLMQHSVLDLRSARSADCRRAGGLSASRRGPRWKLPQMPTL
jgi:hypothetical protein